LKKGPVVLYFYPAAFTTACAIEARDFSEAEAADRDQSIMKSYDAVLAIKPEYSDRGNGC
jgi:peroxiredoxin Q/BCP